MTLEIELYVLLQAKTPTTGLELPPTTIGLTMIKIFTCTETQRISSEPVPALAAMTSTSNECMRLYEKRLTLGHPHRCAILISSSCTLIYE